MAFFKPDTANFWEGNVTKFGISSDNEIVDYEGNAVTHPNGAIKDDAIPYWQTKDWATSMPYGNRNIYTYLGTNVELVHSDNAFETDNNKLTAAILGSPTNSVANIINYVRGKDVFDEDGNSLQRMKQKLHISRPAILGAKYAANQLAGIIGAKFDRAGSYQFDIIVNGESKTQAITIVYKVMLQNEQNILILSPFLMYLKHQYFDIKL